MHALLHIAGLVDHQDRTRFAERVDDVVAQVIAHGISVPTGPRQQMLQRVGSGGAAVLSDGPAILSVQARNHPSHQRTSMPKRFEPTKSRRDPIQYRRELRLPTIRVYAMSRGGRDIFRSIHKLRTMPRSPL
jgi:hypothetical protein